MKMFRFALAGVLPAFVLRRTKAQYKKKQWEKEARV
jgi:hypothetical protein